MNSTFARRFGVAVITGVLTLGTVAISAPAQAADTGWRVVDTDKGKGKG